MQVMSLASNITISNTGNHSSIEITARPLLPATTSCKGRERELKEALDALTIGFSLVVYAKQGMGKSTFLRVLEEKAARRWCTHVFFGLQRQHFCDAVRDLGGEVARGDTIATLIRKIVEAAQICERFVFFCDDVSVEKALMLLRSVNAQCVFAFDETSVEQAGREKELATCYFLELKPLSKEAMYEIARECTSSEERIHKAIAESYGNPFALITALDESKRQVTVRSEYDVTIFAVLFFVFVLAYRFISLASRDYVAYATAGSIWALYYLVRFFQHQRGRKVRGG